MSYSPVLGRFLQRDPLVYVDGGSLYEYVASSPADELDPSGEKIAIGGTGGDVYAATVLEALSQLCPAVKLEIVVSGGGKFITAKPKPDAADAESFCSQEQETPIGCQLLHEILQSPYLLPIVPTSGGDDWFYPPKSGKGWGKVKWGAGVGSKGFVHPPYILLGHELIHAWTWMWDDHDQFDQEWFTTPGGKTIWNAEKAAVSGENQLALEHGLCMREDYLGHTDGLEWWKPYFPVKDSCDNMFASLPWGGPT